MHHYLDVPVLFIQAPTRGHLDCFHVFLVIKNKVVENIPVQVSVLTHVFNLLGKNTWEHAC